MEAGIFFFFLRCTGVFFLTIWLLYSLLRHSENLSVTPPPTPRLWEVILPGKTGSR